VEQSDFAALMAGYFPFFFLYLFVCYRVVRWEEVRFFLVVSVLLRLLLVFAFPGLSDDIYRFVWDGRLLLAGVNPFDQLPSAYMAGTERIAGLDEALYRELNSPDYFTIYPPVCQAIFAGACWLFPQSLVGAAMAMKVVFLFFEIGSLYLLVKLLRHYGLPEKNALLYALNPLIILELVGNLHFEAAMVFFLLLAMYCLEVPVRRGLGDPVTGGAKNARWRWSAVAMAISIASKLLPLLFLPFLILRLGWRKSMVYFAIIGVVLFLLFFPLFNGVFLSNFGNSLNLYFQKFEFNASLYYVLRWLGFQLRGYNTIQSLGPALALFSGLGILGMALWEWRSRLSDERSFMLPTLLLFAISWYLLFTTTVHPWYLTLPLVLSVFGRFRYPVLWSGLVMLTYVNYGFGAYREVLWVVAVEYVLVFAFFLWEGFSWRGFSRGGFSRRGRKGAEGAE
jgi:alpha-1,6-mannosyltransferase